MNTDTERQSWLMTTEPMTTDSPENSAEVGIDVQRLVVASGLEGKLSVLADFGCYPSISRRGGLWRAHINACGNYWAESAVSPLHALNRAISDWQEAGYPMDGLSCDNVQAHPRARRSLKPNKKQTARWVAHNVVTP